MSIPADANTAAILNLYIYLDDGGATDGDDLKSIMARLANDKRWTEDSDKAAEFRECYNELNEAIKNNPALEKMKISGQSRNMYEDDTVCACAFTSPDGDVYVTFRGTGDRRWVDNGIAFGPNDSPIQREAVEYFDQLCEKYNWDTDTDIVVTGHSKGGNLSQYITMASDNRDLIDSCYSFDGQGFSPEALDRFRQMDGYDRQRDKVWSISGTNDPVNQLGLRLPDEDHVYYVEQDDVDSFNPFEYHKLTNMIDEDGLHNIDKDGPSEIANLFKMLSDEIMTLPPDERESISKSIMEFFEPTDEGTSKATPSDYATAGGVALDYLTQALNNALNKIIFHNSSAAAAFILIKEAVFKFVEAYRKSVYNRAMANPDIYIDTDSFWSLGCRIEAVQKKVRQVEDLLDSVYWWNTSLTLPEYNAVGNANRRVGSTYKLGLCASYLFATAEDFNELESTFS